jgi:hypothetical protein
MYARCVCEQRWTLLRTSTVTPIRLAERRKINKKNYCCFARSAPETGFLTDALPDAPSAICNGQNIFIITSDIVFWPCRAFEIMRTGHWISVKRLLRLSHYKPHFSRAPEKSILSRCTVIVIIIIIFVQYRNQARLRILTKGRGAFRVLTDNSCFPQISTETQSPTTFLYYDTHLILMS